ncbi:MAG TPA: hypothetical protein VNB22_23270 [Pyrinomonadaceae bacterium]|jgi:hypothetical protein|nr:hypothetical protein [Pyrinomonadaceae bacterium]
MKSLIILMRFKIKLLNLLLFPVLFLLAVGYFNQASAQQTSESILAAYNAAIYDASVYKFSNLRPLFPVKFDGNKTATVATLTSYNYTKGETKLGVDVWVTVVPEVQTICRSFSDVDLALRLRQLLGLHPGKNINNFVVFSVKEGDIFRPAANPDPTTVLPCSSDIPTNCGEIFPNNVSPEHIKWMANQMLSSYVISESTLIPIGYPWTRLGYTYDWKPSANKYGASEYIIKKGSTVNVTDIVSYQDYCKPVK